MASMLLLLCSLLLSPLASAAAPKQSATLPSVFFWNELTREWTTSRPPEMLVWSEEHQRHYMYLPDGSMTWEVPAGMVWQLHNESSGRRFYYNAKLNISTYTKPKSLAWEELPGTQLPAKLAELRKEARQRRFLILVVVLPLLYVLVWAIREQNRMDPGWLTRPPVIEKKKKVKMPRGSKYRCVRLSNASQDSRAPATSPTA